MSYILDALKKSEREKTLGQVPTLESVVSDGAKKQRSGTPLWLNIVVFFVALLAIVGILKMAGLLDFSGSDNTASVQTEQSEELAENMIVQESEAEAVAGLPEIEPPAEIVEKSNQIEQAMGNNPQSQETQSNQEIEITDSMRATLELPLPGEDPQPLANAQVTEQVEITDSMRATLESAPLPGETVQSTANSQPIAQVELTESMQATIEQLPPLPEDVSTETEVVQVESQANSAKALEEKFAAQEAEEIAALEQQLAAQQQSNNTQQSQSDYEEVIHDGLRDVSVNVVSYSSDARQRFVMLDLTIYKEGDQLANSAQVIEIIRTGAIVEYQNKRYLLKP